MALSSLLYRLRRSRGSVALEAILSIALMMGAFYSMWGVIVVIYNQSVLQSASRLAADGGLIAFQRRGQLKSQNREFVTASSGVDGAINRGRSVATVLFKENSRGMMADQFSGAVPSATPQQIDIECQAQYTIGSEPDYGRSPVPAASKDWSEANCSSKSYEIGAARVTVTATPYAQLAYFLSGVDNYQSTNPTNGQTTTTLGASASSYAFFPRYAP